MKRKKQTLSRRKRERKSLGGVSEEPMCQIGGGATLRGGTPVWTGSLHREERKSVPEARVHKGGKGGNSESHKMVYPALAEYENTDILKETRHGKNVTTKESLSLPSERESATCWGSYGGPR